MLGWVSAAVELKNPSRGNEKQRPLKGQCLGNTLDVTVSLTAQAAGEESWVAPKSGKMSHVSIYTSSEPPRNRLPWATPANSHTLHY